MYNLIPGEFAWQLPKEAFTFSLNVREPIKSDFCRCDVGRHAVCYLLGATPSCQLETVVDGVARLQLNKPQ